MSVPLILEVAISMVFLYLLGSQVVLSIYELWAGYTNSRGKFLYRRLKGTFGAETIAALYAEKPIAALTPANQGPPKIQKRNKGKESEKAFVDLTIDSANPLAWWMGMDGLPAYIPADLFASTLLAMVAPSATKQADLIAVLSLAASFISQDDIKTPEDRNRALNAAKERADEAKKALEEAQKTSNADTVENAQNTLNEAEARVKALDWYSRNNWYSKDAGILLVKILEGLSPEATLVECQKSVAGWYDDYGERLTGWYKRQVRVWLFLIGLVIAFVGNIDSPFILRYLWAHPQLSSNLADMATQAAQSGTARTAVSPKKPQKTTSECDSAKNAQSRKIDSLEVNLRASKERIQALYNHLHGMGFPIGRADSAGRDSARLPDVFYVRQPARTVRQGRKLVAIPSYYLRYCRSLKTTATTAVPGITGKSFEWLKTALPIENVRKQDLQAPHDRSEEKPWYEPVFGPQSQSAWNNFWGWVLTALALSVGAPFWFDLLCRLVNIRNLGIKPPRPEQ